MAVDLGDPTLRVFALCAALLTLKLLVMVSAIGVLRNTRGVYASPEDYRFRGATPGGPDDLIERVRRVHQNDVENVPLFLGIGLLFALAGGHPTVACVAFVVFTASRFLHTAFYLAALQPWRSIVFGIGSVALVIIPLLLLWRTLG